MGPLLLFITTFIWGTAFLAQKLGGDSLGPVAITVFRNVLGGGFLLALVGLRRLKAGTGTEPGTARKAVLGGAICGVPLFLAMLTQQIGIKYTTPGICAFLTTNYVLFVPLIVAVLVRKLPSLIVTLCAFAALAGTGFICLGVSDLEHFSVGRGEAWTILSAWLFAVQMMCIDRFARRTDVLVMSCSQLFTCCLLGAPLLFLADEMSMISAFEFKWANILPVFYLGVFSSGIAYTLQNYGQARTPPAIAAVVLSLESVFGALSGFIVLGDRMSAMQFTGCAIVFAAALFVQLAPLKGKPDTENKQGTIE